MAIAALDIPPDALLDDDAFELLRLWAANGQLHTVISSDLEGGAEDFAELLADLFEHASRMYSQRDRRRLEDCRAGMRAALLDHLDNPKPSIEGEIPSEH
jgi:hypothetical protein